MTIAVICGILGAVCTQAGQTSSKPPADTEAIGAPKSDALGPVGGGVGYESPVTKWDYLVRTPQELLDALGKARPGQVVYVADAAEIDMTVWVTAYKTRLRLPEGVTLAGGRGVNGSSGGLIFSDEFATRPLIEPVGKNARITGLRLRGPDAKVRDREMAMLFSALGTQPDDGSKGNGDYYKFPTSVGIETTQPGLVIDNCEISGWSLAGVSLLQGADKGHIHHCDIHHCQRRGLGYGVCVDQCEALIEANLLDYCRHAIAGSGLQGTSYEARYNLHGEHTTSHCFDMHGSQNNGVLVDGQNIAGESISIHHNRVMAPNERAVAITGIPRKSCDIHHNWFHTNAPLAAVQMVDPGKSNVRIDCNAVGPDKQIHDATIPLDWQKERRATTMQNTDISTLRAGFARKKITPPLGTRMFGWGGRDESGGCSSIHDDLYVRALWLEQRSEKTLILGFDLLFFSRDVADRLRGAIGRRFGLEWRQVLLNTSHTHSGPTTGTWYTALFEAPDRLYLDSVERAVIEAADGARGSLREVSMSAGTGKTNVAMRRRLPDGKGGVEWKPNPEGVYDAVPICLLKDSNDRPVCLLFSVSCHPSTFFGSAVSADYPGAAMARLDEHLGASCSLFVQGVGGDSKVRGFVDPAGFGKTWEDTARGGEMVAADVISAVDKRLRPVVPSLACFEVEADLPFADPMPTKADFELEAANAANPMKQMWAKNMLSRLERGEQLPRSAPVSVHGIRLAEGVRLIGLEVEAVAEWGPFIQKFYGGGTVFPLGYTDGCQLYLPTTKMLAEGGYEVVSYYEYGWPAPLAPGIEDKIANALSVLRANGIQ